MFALSQILAFKVDHMLQSIRSDKIEKITSSRSILVPKMLLGPRKYHSFYSSPQSFLLIPTEIITHWGFGRLVINYIIVDILGASSIHVLLFWWSWNCITVKNYTSVKTFFFSFFNHRWRAWYCYKVYSPGFMYQCFLELIHVELKLLLEQFFNRISLNPLFDEVNILPNVERVFYSTIWTFTFMAKLAVPIDGFGNN